MSTPERRQRGQGLRSGAGRSLGLSLIELIVFMVIVSGAVIGILSVMNVTTQGSADPMVRKQALAIAESLLEEVMLMPITYCDPDDTAAATATSAASCTGGTGGNNDESRLALGPEGAASVGGAEGRYASPRFDNVSDYNGFSMSGSIKDITDTTITGLGAYTASVTVAQAGASPFSLPNAEVLQIDVRVQAAAAGVDITLTGYRFRYAPTSL